MIEDAIARWWCIRDMSARLEYISWQFQITLYFLSAVQPVCATPFELPPWNV